MDPALTPVAWSPQTVVAAAVCVRVAAAVAVGMIPVLPGLAFRIRLGLSGVLAAAALPMAVSLREGGGPALEGPVVPILLGELLVGLALGTLVAAILSAAAWAGGILGSVSGMTWADDFDPAAAGQPTGIARLAWWVALAAFFAADGQLAVVGLLVDSLRVMPVGAVGGAAAQAWGESLAAGAPAVASSLAVTLAIPALVAVVAFHLAAAICLRAVPFSPGPGLLQGLAALVLLASLWLGAEAWAAGGAGLAIRSIEACLARP